MSPLLNPSPLLKYTVNGTNVKKALPAKINSNYVWKQSNNVQKVSDKIVGYISVVIMLLKCYQSRHFLHRRLLLALNCFADWRWIKYPGIYLYVRFKNTQATICVGSIYYYDCDLWPFSWTRFIYWLQWKQNDVVVLQ